ncbi:MAG: hypothetical protein II650_04180 [Clostridia bacterium]|nr:hypothetical protein [Clostridia bacterium]
MQNDKLTPFFVSAANLAYLGDCVWELCVREKLVKTNIRQPSVTALDFVTAKIQSAAVERLLPHLTEAEEDQYRRGRNISHANIPKSATLAEYRRATGLETHIGWLWLNGDEPRIRELIALAFADDPDSPDKPSETARESEENA